MLVRLWKKGDPRPRRTYVNKIYVDIPVAYFDPISYLFSEPCIVVMPKPRGQRYPLVHERNIIRIINHESLHCVLLKIREYSKYDFDKLVDEHKELGRTGLF
jgi:hypothetical protein